MQLCLLIVLLTLPLAADASSDKNKSDSIVKIFGFVKQAESGRPVKHAKVRLLQLHSSFFGNISRGGMDAPPTLLSNTITDRQGRFSFTTASKGPFEITVFDDLTRQTGGAHPKRLDHPVTILTSKASPSPDFKPPH
jgi:hypothetical protein